MAARPETFSNLSTPDIDQPNPPKKGVIPAWLNRQNLEYATTVGTTTMLYTLGAQELYNLSYKVMDIVTENSDLLVLDKMRDFNTAVSVIGGFVIGDILYRAWNRPRPS